MLALLCISGGAPHIPMIGRLETTDKSGEIVIRHADPPSTIASDSVLFLVATWYTFHCMLRGDEFFFMTACAFGCVFRMLTGIYLAWLESSCRPRSLRLLVPKKAVDIAQHVQCPPVSCALLAECWKSMHVSRNVWPWQMIYRIKIRTFCSTLTWLALSTSAA